MLQSPHNLSSKDGVFPGWPLQGQPVGIAHSQPTVAGHLHPLAGLHASKPTRKGCLLRDHRLLQRSLAACRVRDTLLWLRVPLHPQEVWGTWELAVHHRTRPFVSRVTRANPEPEGSS